MQWGSESAYDRTMLAVCQLLVRFYEILDGESMFLREAVKQEIKTLGFRMGVLYSNLAAMSVAAHEKKWNISPKLHIFVHLCEWQACEFGNPRYYWTYPDEDLVGLLIDIAETCHLKTLAVSALCKWLHLAFDND